MYITTYTLCATGLMLLPAADAVSLKIRKSRMEAWSMNWLTNMARSEKIHPTVVPELLRHDSQAIAPIDERDHEFEFAS